MINRNIFSEQLKLLKTKNDETTVSIATALNIAKQSVHAWETMKTVPSTDKLIELAEYFDVSLDFLVGRCENPNSHKN